VTAPIIGATNLHHIADAAAALDITLSAEEIAALEREYRPQQVQFHRDAAPVAGQTASVDVLTDQPAAF
jgi:diketogulonate reductase-like aldo/keto reductase